MLPVYIHVTADNASDVRTAPAVIAVVPDRRKRLVADRAYDADNLRRDLKATCILPVIPRTRSRKHPVRYNPLRFRKRWPSRQRSTDVRTSGAWCSRRSAGAAVVTILTT